MSTGSASPMTGDDSIEMMVDPASTSCGGFMDDSNDDMMVDTCGGTGSGKVVSTKVVVG